MPTLRALLEYQELAVLGGGVICDCMHAGQGEGGAAWSVASSRRWMHSTGNPGQRSICLVLRASQSKAEAAWPGPLWMCTHLPSSLLSLPISLAGTLAATSGSLRVNCSLPLPSCSASRPIPTFLGGERSGKDGVGRERLCDALIEMVRAMVMVLAVDGALTVVRHKRTSIQQCPAMTSRVCWCVGRKREASEALQDVGEGHCLDRRGRQFAEPG